MRVVNGSILDIPHMKANRVNKKLTFTRFLLLAAVLLFAFFVWAGNTGRFNGQDILYMGRDARTGEIVVVKGCRPERLLPDGSCDQSFR